MLKSQLNLYGHIRASDAGTIGQTVQESFVVTLGHVQASIALGEDTNLLHQDEDFAKILGFKGIVVPEAFFGTRISGFVARNFPDGVVAKSKAATRFLRPCYVGDEVTMYLRHTEHHIDERSGSEEFWLTFFIKNPHDKDILTGGCQVVLTKKLREYLCLI